MSLVLVHLGKDMPNHLIDCIRQVRIWSPSFPVYVVLDEEHMATAFSSVLQSLAEIVYTSEINTVSGHLRFLENYSGDTKFRGKYWRHVKERFYYIYELMLQKNLENVIYSEYDVMFYHPLEDIVKKLEGSKTIRCVRSEAERAHPATLFIPSVTQAQTLATFMGDDKGWDDMVALGRYCNEYSVQYLPCCPSTYLPSAIFLSETFEKIGILFDSLVFGQYLGGVDVRNTNGVKKLYHDNELSWYHFRDFRFSWEQDEEKRWFPTVDGHKLVTIHCHSKATKCFLSNREDTPLANYNAAALLRSLQPN